MESIYKMDKTTIDWVVTPTQKRILTSLSADFIRTHYREDSDGKMYMFIEPAWQKANVIYRIVEKNEK